MAEDSGGEQNGFAPSGQRSRRSDQDQKQTRSRAVGGEYEETVATCSRRQPGAGSGMAQLRRTAVSKNPRRHRAGGTIRRSRDVASGVPSFRRESEVSP